MSVSRTKELEIALARMIADAHEIETRHNLDFAVALKSLFNDAKAAEKLLYRRATK